MRSLRRDKGFTLIELLIVVAIIGILVSILMPSLGKAREKARRAVCLSNLKNCGVVSVLYANDNKMRLNPSDGSNPAVESLHWLGAGTQKGFDPYINNWDITNCSNWPSTGANIAAQGVNYNSAQMIGFVYSGGLDIRNLQGPGEDWIAPQRLTDESNLMLWSDWIMTSNSWGATIPHSFSGFRQGADGIQLDLKKLGSEGGNILLLNGSAKWVSQNAMTGQKGDYNPNIMMWWKIEE